MNKTIIYSGLVFWGILCALSILLHIPKAEIQQTQKINYVIEKDSFPSIEWGNILRNHAQFKEKVDKQSLTGVTSNNHISNSTIIGIITDPPQSSVIIIDKTSTSPQQFYPGDIWFDEWIVKEIKADTVLWKNTKTQKEYTQYLFDLTAKPLDKKTTKRKKKRRK